MGKVSKSGKAGFARLSLTTIAALTPPEHDVTIHDARLAEPDYDGDWDVVGFTGMTAEIPHVYRMADEFRRRGKRVVIGGYHASSLPEEAVQHADAVVVGEAEGLWPRILADMERGGPTERIYRNEACIPLRKMAVPRRDLLDRRMYTVSATIQATRGCPFDCDFCSVTRYFGNSFRHRPVEEVVVEIAQLPERTWMFLDDNLIGQPRFAKELFRALVPLRITWGCQASVNLGADEELLDLFAEAGGSYVFIGFESLSQATLKATHKGFNHPEKYRELVRRLHRRGVTIMGSFVFGFDEDERDVFRRTVDFVNESRMDVVLYHILTPFPGTRLFARLHESGRIHDYNWAHYDCCTSVIQPARMTSVQLQDGWVWATQESYRLPSVAWRILRPQAGWKERLAAAYTYTRKARRLAMASEGASDGESAGATGAHGTFD